MTKARVLSLPRPPELTPPRGIPLFATIAPVAGSLALWLITQSVFALVFAALGPLVALASVGDSRLQRARQRRTEAFRFGRECDALREAIAAGHRAERLERENVTPGALRLLDEGAPGPSHWRSSFGDPILVRLGTGSVASGLRLRDSAVDPPSDENSRVAFDEIRSAAETLFSAPVAVDARGGVGFVGELRVATAAARAVVVQLAAALSPAVTALTAPAGEWEWLELLPHASAEHPNAVVFAGEGGAELTVAVAPTHARLPRGVEIVVEIAGGTGRVIRHPLAEAPGEFLPELVSRPAAAAWAQRQGQLARASGLMPAAAALPTGVGFGQLESVVDPSPIGLRSEFGAASRGVFGVDLVTEGPHAVVGGTTGSGKSELLVSWVLGMAAHRPPSIVNFLFVDFKGGAAFEPLRSLPHCVGLITDLDPIAAARALESLRAEVRYRERSLAADGLRSVDHAAPGTPFPRLVIVVDEYAAMIDAHPGLHSLFADLAARGRSLGIHLILCTQRPGGVVREGVLANCALRLSLRVNNAADSRAVVGTDDAAMLGSAPPGRAIAVSASGAPEQFQVALCDENDIREVRERWRDSPRPRRPWCEPLPAELEFPPATEESLDAVPFGLVDLPAEQRQEVARLGPARQGHLLVIGASGSGKSGVLEALAAGPSRLTRQSVGRGLPCLWDALLDALAHVGKPALLLVDDIDSIVASCDSDYVTALLDLLARVLRDGPARGVHLVLTLQRIPGALQSAAALCGASLLLRMPSRQEHQLAGGEAADFDTGAPAGRGRWQGHAVQVFRPTRTVGVTDAYPLPRQVAVHPGRPARLIAVSRNPAAFARQLSSAGHAVVELGAASGDPREISISPTAIQPVLVGDPETWQLHFGAFGALRTSAAVLFDGCSVSEFRQLTRLRDLPPPGEGRSLWLLEIDGTASRATLATERAPQPVDP